MRRPANSPNTNAIPAGAPKPLVLVVAGVTGGHLFPAEALAGALGERGAVVELATDERATRYGAQFPARATHVIPSATFRGRDPVAAMRTCAILGSGLARAWRLLGVLRPVAVIGFGGYPTVPPLVAATLRGVPSLIHEQNAVLGRANRLLAPRVTAIAAGFPGVTDADPKLRAKTALTGNPVRPAVVAASATPYPEMGGPLRLVVFGGSQGARIFADIVPPAIERLDGRLRARLSIVQQARDEDLDRVRRTYEGLAVAAEVAPFFPDLPTRIAEAHLVVSRAGASTVAELSAIGRPAILVPLPHALDQDQLANATVLAKAGGAVLLRQDAFTAERLATELAALAGDAERLRAMAVAARAAGSTDAAGRLADLVLSLASD